jgi:hypothetical protein
MKETKTMKCIYELRNRHYRKSINMSRDEYIKSIKDDSSQSKHKAIGNKK